MWLYGFRYSICKTYSREPYTKSKYSSMEGRLLGVLLLPMTSATQLAEEPQVARGGGGLLRGGGGLEHSFLPIEAQ